MTTSILTFFCGLVLLLLAARYFTNAAERIGKYLGLSPFVVGVFIVGIGTSLPELISAILSVHADASEIIPGNVMGSAISNLLLITGIAALIARPVIQLGSRYILVDMHYLLGAFFLFALVAYDGTITALEGAFGIVTFLVYSIYLIRQGGDELDIGTKDSSAPKPSPVRDIAILIVAGVGIYFGADLTVTSITEVATAAAISPALIALTVLSIGTTLPELAVNVTAIRQGRSEMAIGNVLGSCVFNALVVPAAGSFFGDVNVPHELITFSLPVMLGAGAFFYLLTNDKRVSRWEGWIFILLYVMFIVQLTQR